MLNAISHYIQNQPYGSATAANESAESQATGTATKAGKPAPLVMGDYTPSTRAVLVSAVASDYDVRALDAKSLGTLQNKLLQYGLIGGRDLDAFSVINVARGEQADNDVIDNIEAQNLLYATDVEFNYSPIHIRLKDETFLVELIDIQGVIVDTHYAFISLVEEGFIIIDNE